MSEETGFILVREFPDRGTRWLLESPGNVRELVRLVATDLMDLPQALHRFVPHHDTLLLSLREADPEELAVTGHPLGWVLRVMQQEGATQEELAAALQEAMEILGRLPSEEQAAWRQAVYYLLLLIYHRREPQERDLMAQVVLESVRERLRREEIGKLPCHTQTTPLKKLNHGAKRSMSNKSARRLKPNIKASFWSLTSKQSNTRSTQTI